MNLSDGLLDKLWLDSSFATLIDFYGKYDIRVSLDTIYSVYSNVLVKDSKIVENLETILRELKTECGYTNVNWTYDIQCKPPITSGSGVNGGIIIRLNLILANALIRLKRFSQAVELLRTIARYMKYEWLSKNCKCMKGDDEAYNSILFVKAVDTLSKSIRIL